MENFQNHFTHLSLQIYLQNVWTHSALVLTLIIGAFELSLSAWGKHFLVIFWKFVMKQVKSWNFGPLAPFFHGEITFWKKYEHIGIVPPAAPVGLSHNLLNPITDRKSFVTVTLNNF